MSKKKPRKKAYRPKKVDIFPEILMDGEPFETSVKRFESEINDGFIQLHLGAGGSEAYRSMMKFFLQGEILAENFNEEDDLQTLFEAAMTALADALFDFERDGRPNPEMISEAEAAVPTLMETVRRASVKQLIIARASARKNGDALLDEVLPQHYEERKALSEQV